MIYGSAIGRKFSEDGFAMRYPGNTVIADVRPGCAAYGALTRLREIALAAGLSKSMIFLPEDSYHMTVIRGLNDRVRTPEYWPAPLPTDCAMAVADDYVRSAVAGVPGPGALRMRFMSVRATREDLRVLACPSDDAQARALRAYRDAVADALKLRLPGHDAYSYHITLAYTLLFPEDGEETALSNALARMEAALRLETPEFVTEAPYMAFYDDMLSFHRERIR